MQETQEMQARSLGREDSPGGGNGYPLQYSCLENPIDRRAWREIQSMGLQSVGHDLATKYAHLLELLLSWVISLGEASCHMRITLKQPYEAAHVAQKY